MGHALVGLRDRALSSPAKGINPESHHDDRDGGQNDNAGGIHARRTAKATPGAA
jgi:hypothetical protein